MIKVVTMASGCERVTEYLQSTGGPKMVGAGDVVHVALDEQNEIVGLFAAREIVLVHEFRVTAEMRKRQVAEALWHYAMGAAKSAGHTTGLLVVDSDNHAMLRFVDEAGVYQYGEPDKDKIFLVKVG